MIKFKQKIFESNVELPTFFADPYKLIVIEFISGLTNNYGIRSRRLVAEYNEGFGLHSRMKVTDNELDVKSPVAAVENDVVEVWSLDQKMKNNLIIFFKLKLFCLIF